MSSFQAIICGFFSRNQELTQMEAKKRTFWPQFVIPKNLVGTSLRYTHSTCHPGLALPLPIGAEPWKTEIKLRSTRGPWMLFYAILCWDQGFQNIWQKLNHIIMLSYIYILVDIETSSQIHVFSNFVDQTNKQRTLDSSYLNVIDFHDSLPGTPSRRTSLRVGARSSDLLSWGSRNMVGQPTEKKRENPPFLGGWGCTGSIRIHPFGGRYDKST